MQRLTLQHKPWRPLREETVPISWLVILQFHVCTSLAPRPMTVAFGLGTRVRVRMRTTLQNGVLRNGQQPGRAMKAFLTRLTLKL